MNRQDVRVAKATEFSSQSPLEGAALEQLAPLLYLELRELAASCMRHERNDHTLQATALVNEAYLKLVDQSQVQWRGRNHFLAMAGRMMRRILTDHARARRTLRRGAGWVRVPASEIAGSTPTCTLDLLALDDALGLLAKTSPRQAQVVEMRYFAGLDFDAIALVLRTTRRTAEREWRYAQVFLYRQIEGPGTTGAGGGRG